MKIVIFLFFIIISSIFLFGCSKEQSPEQKSPDMIYFDGVEFHYRPLPIRNRRYRTDEFTLNEKNCLLMKGTSWVDNTFHETHFMVTTDLDLCKYDSVKLNSTLHSVTYRESVSPSSQVWIQGIKYSSHSMDNQTWEKHSHNLTFISDGSRLFWIDSEREGWATSCGNLTIVIRDSGGENGTAMSSLEICDIEFGDEI